MLSQRQAIKAIKKAKKVLVVTRLTEHDMGYMKGIKSDVIRQINYFAKKGVTEFNVISFEDGDVVIG